MCLVPHQHMDAHEIVESFNARAERYATDDWHRRYAEQLVDATPIQPGDRVLDAGTGTGFAACAIARRVGPAGRVIGIDLSPAMLEQARRGIDAARLGNVDLIEGDATDLHDLHALPVSSLDAVVCSAGLLYMPVAQALSAWHRVLKPNGVMAFSTMRAGSPPAGRIFRACAAKFGVDLKDRSEALGTEDRCRAALEAAGFDRIEVRAGEVAFEAIDSTLAWEANFRGAGHVVARTLSLHQQEELRQQYISAYEKAMRDDRANCAHADVLFAIGRRPELAAP
jgi:ubiquinone/menaquinone biosynthesis C-methylase UbiE